MDRERRRALAHRCFDAQAVGSEGRQEPQIKHFLLSLVPASHKSDEGHKGRLLLQPGEQLLRRRELIGPGIELGNGGGDQVLHGLPHVPALRLGQRDLEQFSQSAWTHPDLHRAVGGQSVAPGDGVLADNASPAAPQVFADLRAGTADNALDDGRQAARSVVPSAAQSLELAMELGGLFMQVRQSGADMAVLGPEDLVASGAAAVLELLLQRLIDGGLVPGSNGLLHRLLCAAGHALLLELPVSLPCLA